MSYAIVGPNIKRLSDGVVFLADDRDPLFADYVEWLADGNAPGIEPYENPSDTKLKIGSQIQEWIDGVCRGAAPYFRDIFSARGYVGDPNPAYHARAVALRDWSSAVWTTLDEIEADALAGNRPFPTTAELFAELPSPP